MVIRSIAPNDSIERYTALGVEVLAGKATLINPWTVEVALNSGQTQRLTTRSIVIAAGAQPVVPDVPGMAEGGYVTTDTLWATLAGMDAIPQRIVLLGGGPIGCELAQSLARLGAAVTLVKAAPRLLLREDEDVSAHAEQVLTKEGVLVLTGHKALRCTSAPKAKSIVVTSGGVEQSLPFDLLICAVGRLARLTGYGMETLGISTGRTVQVNGYLQTQYPHIYVAGDAAGPHQFTHMAAHQAWYAAVNALFGNFKMFKVDYCLVPHATFMDPEIARVGLNISQAVSQGVPFEVTRYAMASLDRAVADGDDSGFVQVLTVPGKDTILGVTVVASQAGELIAPWVLAMKHGIGLNRILATIHTYPTLSESTKYAAGVWKRAHQPTHLLRWAERWHRWRRG